jgi:hypothetical protein
MGDERFTSFPGDKGESHHASCAEQFMTGGMLPAGAATSHLGGALIWKNFERQQDILEHSLQ